MKKFLTAFLVSILYVIPVYCGPLMDSVNEIQEVKKTQQKEQQYKINYPRVWNGYGLTEEDIYKAFISIAAEIERPNKIDDFARELALKFLQEISGEKGYLTGADFKYMCKRWDWVFRNKHECDIFVKTFADLEPKIDKHEDKLSHLYVHGFDGWLEHKIMWEAPTLYGIVRGGAACIETNYGVNIGDMKKDLILTPGVNRGEYCWCQVLEPFVSNWVHVSDFSEKEDGSWKPVDSHFAEGIAVHLNDCAESLNNCVEACHRILENETITKMLTDYARNK